MRPRDAPDSPQMSCVCVCVYVCVCVCPLQVTHRDMVPHHDHDSRAKVLCALVCVLVSWYVCLYEITDRRALRYIGIILGCIGISA